MRRELSFAEARKRNLLFLIAKGIVDKKSTINDCYTLKDIQSKFFFRNGDINLYLNDFFDISNEQFLLNQQSKEKIECISDEHFRALPKLNDAKTVYIKTFGRFYTEIEMEKHHTHIYEFLNPLYNEIKSIIPVLHWGLLPIYKEQIFLNCGFLPEVDLIEYYNHYHMLTDLLNITQGNEIKPSLKGDMNLNQRLAFSVYSRRWRHNDTYQMERTIDGWKAGHIAINGKCKKNGEGALFENLRHDSIFFPEEGIEYALSTLWEMADEEEMTIEELQSKLQQVADWISEVEKTVGKHQPNWCNYYSPGK